MHAAKGLRLLALTAVGFAVSTARADMITPDSIPNPPPAVASANGTAVYANNLVSNQYGRLGLGFGNSLTAITRLNGIPVWAPVEGVAIPAVGVIGHPIPNYPVGMVNYFSPWSGASLNSLGTQQPLTASRLTVETVSHPGFLWLRVYGHNGQVLNITPMIRSMGNTQIWTFTGAGISSFGVNPPVDFEGAGLVSNSPWGVAAVSFAPAEGQTPEPSSLALAGLGVLGLAVSFGWRRKRLRMV